MGSEGTGGKGLNDEALEDAELRDEGFRGGVLSREGLSGEGLRGENLCSGGPRDESAVRGEVSGGKMGDEAFRSGPRDVRVRCELEEVCDPELGREEPRDDEVSLLFCRAKRSARLAGPPLPAADGGPWAKRHPAQCAPGR